MISAIYLSELVIDLQTGTPLKDGELYDIHEGLDFIVKFFEHQKNYPIAAYYRNDLESVKRYQEARNNKQMNTK